MRNVDTFFRGRRRESFIEGAAILCNAAGEKRLKLSMKIPLVGDQLITFDGVRMCSFKIERENDNESEHPDIALTFTAYLPRTGRFLQFADENFASSLYILYEAAQPSLLDSNPNVKSEDDPLPLKANAGDEKEEEGVDDDEDDDDAGNEDEEEEDEPGEDDEKRRRLWRVGRLLHRRRAASLSSSHRRKLLAQTVSSSCNDTEMMKARESCAHIFGAGLWGGCGVRSSSPLC
jgi:hypothetical protein